MPKHKKKKTLAQQSNFNQGDPVGNLVKNVKRVFGLEGDDEERKKKARKVRMGF